MSYLPQLWLPYGISTLIRNIRNNLDKDDSANSPDSPTNGGNRNHRDHSRDGRVRELADSEETAEITSRGQLVARLIPVSPAERAFDEMLRQGEVIPAKRPGGLAGWKPLPAREDGASLPDALIALRDAERE